jgi:hypothetical protein
MKSKDRGLDFIYEGESVKRSQMDIEHKTCDILTSKRHLYLDIFSIEHWYTYPIALPLRLNPQHVNKSIDSCLTHIRTSVWTSSSLREFLLCSEFFCSHKTHNRTPLFCSTHLKPASEHAHARLLPRLCCYLVIHITSVLLTFVTCLLNRISIVHVESCILFWRLT